MKAFVTLSLLALALPGGAAAAAPTQEVSAWDRTRVVAASAETCPFDILVHSTGTLHVWTFEDGTQKTILQNFHIVWTNLQTGATATSPLGGPVSVTPDGTVIVNGNDGRFIARGEGPVVADLGRTVIVGDDVVFSAGQHSATLFPDACAALA